MRALLPLGNDVVDLQSARNRASAANPRFLDRVLAAPEREALVNAADQHATFWAYWTAKEAAYKALKKTDPELIFAHRRFIVDTAASPLIDAGCGMACGTVQHADQSVTVMWSWNADFVHCLTGTDSDPILSGVCAIDERRDHEQFSHLKKTDHLSDESAAARSIALDLLHGQGIANARIVRQTVGNRRGPPHILQHGAPLANFDISLSHDGRFAAAAIRKA